MQETMPDYLRVRGGLPHTARALRAGRLTVGYIGGSITEARVEHNWPEFVTAWLVDAYPAAEVCVENAAIGGTGSDLGLFRAERDLIARGCDLILVEYAVNDQPVPTALRQKSREGLLRKLLTRTEADVVLVYTYMHEMYGELLRGEEPASIAELERLAAHYRLSAAFAGRYVFDLMRRGLVRYNEWLPDNLHPQSFGSRLYAETVTALLAAGLEREEPPRPLPPPLDPDNWEGAALLDLARGEWSGPWWTYRSHTLVWADRLRATCAPGSRMRIAFSGRGAYLITSFGKLSADYRFAIDDGPMQPSAQDYPDWCGPTGWMRAQLLAYPLSAGPHTLTLEVVCPKGPGVTGLRFDLIGIGVVP